MEGEFSPEEMAWEQHLARVEAIAEDAEDRLEPGEIVRLAELLDTQERGALSAEQEAERTGLMAKLAGRQEGAESE